MSDRRASSRPGDSFMDDQYYRPIEAPLERKYGLPDGALGAIRKQGERSNRSAVSEAGARSVYQIIPPTRNAFLRKYGVNAYSGDAAAATVAALHLKESMDRNDGDFTASVAEYHGGPNRAQHGPINRAYVERVTGKAPGIIDVPGRGTTALDPSVDLSQIDVRSLVDVAPADIGSRKPLMPKAPTPEDVAPKPSGASVIMQGRVGMDLTPGSEQQTTAAEKSQERGAVQAEAERRENEPSFFKRVDAAISKNWILPMLERGLNQQVNEGDPAWHQEYVAKQDELEQFAQDQDELDMLRSSRAQRSRADFVAVQSDIQERRKRNAIINSGSNGWAFDVGTAFVDPVGWAATAGVGKIAQIGRAGIAGGRAAAMEAVAGRTGLKTSLLGTASEGAIANVGFTGALDYSGESQTTADYLMSGAIGAGIGAALHGVSSLAGRVDQSDAVGYQEAYQAAQRVEREVREAAIARLGPDAPEAAVETAMKQGFADRAEQAIRMAVGERPDADRFAPVDPGQTRVAEKQVRERIEQANNLDRFPDPAERGLAAEIVARSDEMVATAKQGGTLDKGLEGRFLKMFGQESDALTLLRSNSSVLQAFAIQMLESTTGAGGRKPSAAISMVLRERSYMGHMIEYDQNFELWRRQQGIGKASSWMDPKHRAAFDREVFREVEGRFGDIQYVTSNPAIKKAADAWERGMEQMRREMQSVKALGHERLGSSSRGYMRHQMDPRKVMALTATQRRNVERQLAKQFQALNEYTYVVKKPGDPAGEAGEKITKNFDAKFSRELAKRYLDEAIGRGRGSQFVPVNLHTSESATIVKDAITAMQGLGPEERAAILGAYSRGGPSFTKGRLRMDLNEDIGDGMLLGDLFNQDILSLYRSYARRTAGEVAMAQYGVYGKPMLETFRRTADAQNASVDELKAFERVASEFLNEPWGKYDNIGWAKNLRTITSAARLGGMGFTQFGELGNAIPAVGVRAVLSNIGSIRRLRKEIGMWKSGQAAKNPILDDFDATYGFIGGDGYNMTRLFDAPENNIELYDQESIGVLTKAIRAGSHFNSVSSGFRMIHAVQVRGMSEQIVKKALRFIHLNKESKALDDMGVTQEMRDYFTRYMDKLATFDSRGNLKSLDLYAAPEIPPRVIQDFAQTVERGAGQIIQRTFIGETGPWAHNEFLKLLLQFRTFGVTSIEKQWGRNVANYGALRSLAVLVGAMGFALPIHFARVHTATLGMSRKDREEYLEKRLNVAAMARATVAYTSTAGLAPDLFDVMTTFGSKVGVMPEGMDVDLGIRGRRPGLEGIIPSAGIANDALRGTVGAEFYKLPKLLPGSNNPVVVGAINGLTPEDE